MQTALSALHDHLFDGVTFEMFLERVNNHPRCCINYDPSHFVLQQLDYLEFIDIYHSRIKALHIKGRRVPSQWPSGRVLIAGARARRSRLAAELLSFAAPNESSQSKGAQDDLTEPKMARTSEQGWFSS